MNLQSKNCIPSNIERYLAGDLPADEVEQLNFHLEDCAACREHLETHAADAQAWKDASSFLKKDSFDDEAFLSTFEGRSSQSTNAATTIDQIVAALAPSEHPNHLGRIGIYEVTGVVGSGSTGVVFKAIDPSLDRTVAIKVLSPILASSGAARKRFERESKAAAAVLHPNVMPIHGVSSFNGLSFLVMAYVGGESLQQRLMEHGQFEITQLLRIGSQVAAGLAAAHDQGLVHRDIKPANIMLEDNVERIAITDFGLARAVDDASITRDGVIAGTPRYMSPEQARGQSVTQQTDLFSLGSVLYAMATGRPPFRSQSSYSVMRKICEETPTPIRELNPAVPDWLVGAIDKLMAKAPADRFGSAQEVSTLLEGLLAHLQQPTDVQLPEPIRKLATQSKQAVSTRPFLLSAKVLAVTLLVAILAGLGTYIAQQNLVFYASPSPTQKQAVDEVEDVSRLAFFTGAFVYENDGQRFLHVRHEGDWYELDSISGVSKEEIFKYADKAFTERRFKKRLKEDLPTILQMMGVKFTKAPLPVVLKSNGGELKEFSIGLSRDKRVKLMSSRGTLPAEMLETDLTSFEKSLRDQFAYFRANDVDLKTEIRQLLKNYPNGIEGTLYSLELKKIMAKFIDGHAEVDGFRQPTEQTLPFLIEPAGDRFVAFYDNRESLVDSDFPFVTKIDNVPVEDLIENFAPMIAQGSPQYVLRQKLRAVRDLGLARKLSGLPMQDKIPLELANEAGVTKAMTLFASDNMPTYGTWPRRPKDGLLKGNIGYVRLDSMDRSAPKAIRNWMGRFADTDGLIVDVRDNGGGSRAALLELAGYLMTPDQAPQVANACKYRLFKEFDEDHLESRFAYRAASTRFDKREKKAIKDFKQSFRPEWEPNEADFSDWHYLVLSKRADDARPFYGKSVVILMNEKCFSATDIFLGAFKGWPNVTLVGQPSGGGSARSEEFQLPISEIEISCASMASFQPNGKLYDTNGIEPDVLVEPTPDYFIRGGSDPFLEKAMELLANKTVADHTHLTDVSAKYRERRDYVPPPKGLSPRQTVDGFLCELAAGKKRH